MKAGSVLTVVLAAVAALGAAGPSSSAPSSQLAPLIRYAILLEKDAQHDQTSDKGAAKAEIAGSIAVLQQALALGPPRAVASSLRQALTKDNDAFDLLSTVNQDKVRLDLVTAQSRKEDALKTLGEPVKGDAIPRKPGQAPVKPLPAKPAKPKKLAPKPVPKPKAQTVRQKTIKLLDQSLNLENESQVAFDQLDDPRDGYLLLSRSTGKLQTALKTVQGDPSLFDAGLEIYLALDHDYEIGAILLGLDDGCPVCEADHAYDHKLNALEDLGVKVGKPSFYVKPVSAVFVQKDLATKYTVEVVTRGKAKPKLRYSWLLTLELIDPPGSRPVGNPDAAAGFDPTCNNAYLRGGSLLGADKFGAAYVWRNLTDEFTWYHGDPGAYPGSSYGCNHRKMGPSGHQGIVSVGVSDGTWVCTSTIDGSNLGLTSVKGFASPCLYRPG